MKINLNGPEIKPSSGNKAQQLVIFLHGYGSNGDDLITLAHELKTTLPNAHFLSPNAPFPYEYGGIGYQWFNFNDRDEDILYLQIEKAAVILNNFIDTKLKEFNLTDENLILIGFSQGTMMALHVAPRRLENCIVIGYSGMIVKGDKLHENIQSKPEILLIHGKEDEVLGYHSFEKAVEYLESNQIPLEYHLINNLGHSINFEVLEITKEYLASRF